MDKLNVLFQAGGCVDASSHLSINCTVSVHCIVYCTLCTVYTNIRYVLYSVHSKGALLEIYSFDRDDYKMFNQLLDPCLGL